MTESLIYPWEIAFLSLSLSFSLEEKLQADMNQR